MYMFILSRIRVCIIPSVTAVLTAVRVSGESSWTRVTLPLSASCGCLKEPTPLCWSTSTRAPTELTEQWGDTSSKKNDHDSKVIFVQVSLSEGRDVWFCFEMEKLLCFLISHTVTVVAWRLVKLLVVHFRVYFYVKSGPCLADKRKTP